MVIDPYWLQPLTHEKEIQTLNKLLKDLNEAIKCGIKIPNIDENRLLEFNKVIQNLEICRINNMKH